MKLFLRKWKWVLCLLAAALVLAGVGTFRFRSEQQDMFQDLTIELGTESISLRSFMTEHADASRVSFVSDPASIDLNQVGTTELTLRHGRKEETVTLTIQDTTAPEAVIEQRRTVPINAIPEAVELVSDIKDMSEVTVSYAYEPVVPVDYRDVTVVVVVEDAWGNRVEGECVFSFHWMRESVALELGEKLTVKDVLLDPKRDELLVDKSQLNTINKSTIGQYQVVSATDSQETVCTVTVQDTKGPDLNLREVRRYPGITPHENEFVASASDVSGGVTVRMVSELPDCSVVGQYPIVFEATDLYGNVTRKETTLWIATDFWPPMIYGNLSKMTVEKHSNPDFMEGITARDNVDGEVSVVCDTGNLDLTKAGTYYISYSATDKSGNSYTVKRAVEVQHDQEDTSLLVDAIADTLSSNPEEIRDYVRTNIGYNTNWGGEDPVWYGFTSRVGNCYVHALCLQELLTRKGFETQIIHVTNKTHYWLLIKLGDTWRHIDATPSSLHSRYSLMTDEQRLSTLSGRTWDFDAWPACE